MTVCLKLTLGLNINMVTCQYQIHITSNGTLRLHEGRILTRQKGAGLQHNQKIAADET